MSIILCWFLGHRWEPEIRNVEYWYQTEEIGEGGGYYMETHVSPTPGNDKEEWEEVYHTRQCSRCGMVQRLP